MTTPSYVVWAHRDEPPVGPVPGVSRPTVRQTAERIVAGDPWQHAVRELLDGLLVEQSPDLAEPAHVSEQVDAYLAAVVEHVCAERGLQTPAWVAGPTRFMRRFWWPNGNEAFDAVCVRDSPAAFRRRGIFIGATTSTRV